MTSKSLYEKINPIRTHTYIAQFLTDGLNVNMSDVYTRLIKDAARCNSYSSDVYYDIKFIESSLKEYNPNVEFEPIWIGFRKMGVDGTSFVLSRNNEQNLYSDFNKNYFALYSLVVRHDQDDFYIVQLNEYGV